MEESWRKLENNLEKLEKHGKWFFIWFVGEQKTSILIDNPYENSIMCWFILTHVSSIYCPPVIDDNKWQQKASIEIPVANKKNINLLFIWWNNKSSVFGFYRPKRLFRQFCHWSMFAIIFCTVKWSINYIKKWYYCHFPFAVSFWPVSLVAKRRVKKCEGIKLRYNHGHALRWPKYLCVVFETIFLSLPEGKEKEGKKTKITLINFDFAGD